PATKEPRNRRPKTCVGTSATAPTARRPTWRRTTDITQRDTTTTTSLSCSTSSWTVSNAPPRIDFEGASPGRIVHARSRGAGGDRRAERGGQDDAVGNDRRARFAVGGRRAPS